MAHNTHSHEMSWFERWFFKRMLNKLVRDGYYAHGNVIDIFKMVTKQWDESFYEDNRPTKQADLREALEKSFDVL